MSPDPCFSDTCSVDLEFDGSGPGLTAAVKISDCEDRLECTPETEDCSEGLILVVGFQRFAIQPDLISIPDGSDVVYDLGTNFQNATGRDRLLIARTDYALQHTVTADAGGTLSDRAYKIETAAQLLFNGAAQWTNSNVVQGIARSNPAESDFLILEWNVTHHQVIPAGTLVDVDLRFVRDEPTAGGGYDATIDTSGGTNGLNVLFSAVMIDLDRVTSGLVTLI